MNAPALSLLLLLAARPAFEPVPLPPLSPLEPEVASQIEVLHSELAAALARPGVPPGDVMEAYGLLGEHLHAYDLFEGAAACYRNALLVAPRDYRWLHLLADAARRMGDDAEAIRWNEAARNVRPEDAPTLVALGELYAESGRLDEAEASFRDALAKHPACAAALAGLGSVALGRGAFAEAARHLEAALRLVPDATRLRYELGMAYRGLGRREEARAQLALRGSVGVRTADPLVEGLRSLVKGEMARVVRGRLLFANGRFAEAAEEFAAAARSAPRSAANHVALGSALASAGCLEEAERSFRTAVELEPANATARFDLGLLLSRRGKSAEALPHLRAAADALPRDAAAQRMLAETLAATGALAEAVGVFRTAWRLAPRDEDVLLGGASALTRLERFREARDVLASANRELPESGRIARALAHLLAACPDRSLRDGARAFDLAQRVHAAIPSAEHARLLALARAECGPACER